MSGEELYRLFLNGDEDAFTGLVALYQDGLAHFINRIVNDRHEAEHLTIETFAKLAVGGKAFAGKSSLKTYLYTIGKNLALKTVKARGREQHLSYEDVVGVLDGGEETPDIQVEREERRQMLHKTMSYLSDDHRAVLALLYFEGMSYVQAGRAMNKSEKQIKHLAYRAKASLKKKLDSSDYNFRVIPSEGK
ncbi:MAG: sigma-70 family RNA polymerase sigma factor [Oscillospiraceae bacterium]|nr:sigma-70 family RNA polymerase sigma factor [Oscillospiraceae bacterium]